MALRVFFHDLMENFLQYLLSSEGKYLQNTDRCLGRLFIPSPFFSLSFVARQLLGFLFVTIL